MKQPRFVDGLGMHFHIVRETSEFLALEEEWDRLWRTCSGQSYESFYFCRQCLVNNSSAEDVRLWCLTGRRNGRLALVWPLVITRQGIWKVVRPLAAGAADYTVLLVEAATATDMEEDIAAAWKIVRSRSRADILSLPYIREDRVLYSHLPPLKLLSLATTDHAPLARLRNETSWETFSLGLRSKANKRPKDLIRRIGREGSVAMRIYGREHPRQCEELVDWMLAQKAEWARRTGKSGHWIASTDYRNLLVSLLTLAPPHNPHLVFVLTLNEKPIAACIAGVGQGVAYGIITAYDDAYAKFSPGVAILEYQIRWAIDLRIDLDLGVGTETYKLFWSKDNLVRTLSLTIPLSTLGSAALLAKRIISLKDRGKGK
ncbi:GNAT family N-acetyltransferase [Paraburkholderia sediminicola]|uniref:GNAT family N-acetyltransferase n=1 Tax=Paraburkholderia rhynchosiae TaxID=487049 RepID=A0ACC7N698_9BURK